MPLKLKGQKVALYCRSAVANKRAMRGQEKFLRKHARENGDVVVGVYKDNGKSGNSFDRPALKRLLRDIKEGKADAVLTMTLDRIGRNHKVVEKILGSIVHAGAEVQWCRPIRDDPLALLMLFAGFESKAMSKRIKRGLKHKKEKQS